jgi:hypothetical protein
MDKLQIDVLGMVVDEYSNELVFSVAITVYNPAGHMTKFVVLRLFCQEEYLVERIHVFSRVP